MPWKPPSHSQRFHAGAQADRAYNQTVRLATPSLAEAQRLRNTKRWRILRDQVREEEPWCRNPYGLHRMRKEAVDVDHIVPLTIRPDLAYERSNVQGLCRACHNHKTRQERQGTREQSAAAL